MGSRQFTVVFDPGHGALDADGVTPLHGRETGGLRESELNLSLSEALKKELEKFDKKFEIRVKLTRNEPVANNADRETGENPNAPLTWRTKKFPPGDDENRTDVFISIHHDARPPDKQGTHIYVHPKSTPYSKQLADEIARAVKGEVKLNDFRVTTPDFHKRADGSERLAMLIEVGNMNNPADLEKAKDPASVQKTAQAIAKSIAQYFETPQAQAGFPKVEKESSSASNNQETSNNRLARKPPALTPGSF